MEEEQEAQEEGTEQEEVSAAHDPSTQAALNDALVREQALKQVLAKHNIAVDAAALDTSGMKVENGSVTGEVAYSPPGVSNRLRQGEGAYRQRAASAAAPSKAALSLDDVANWSPAEVNSRWDEVQSLLKQ